MASKRFFLPIRLTEQENDLVERLADRFSAGNRSELTRVAILELAINRGFISAGSNTKPSKLEFHTEKLNS